MKIEYLITYTKDGFPVYSKCFGGFCANVTVDDTLMSGFLSALSTLPQMLGDSSGIQNIEMGYTKFYFNKLADTLHYAVLGINKETILEQTDILVQDVFAKLNHLLSTTYNNTNWTNILREERDRLDADIIALLEEATGGKFEDNCYGGEDCPMHSRIRKEEERGKTITELLSIRYNLGKIKKFVSKLFKPVVTKKIKSDTRHYHSSEST